MERTKSIVSWVFLLVIAAFALLFALPSTSYADPTYNDSHKYYETDDAVKGYFSSVQPKSSNTKIVINPNRYGSGYDKSQETYLYVCTDYDYYYNTNNGETEGGAVFFNRGEPTPGNVKPYRTGAGEYSGWFVLQPRYGGGDYAQYFDTGSFKKTGYTDVGVYSDKGVKLWSDDGYAQKSSGWWNDKKDLSGGSYPMKGFKYGAFWNLAKGKERYCYARFTANTYNISYNLNGGTCVTAPTSGTYDSAITISNPTREGYAFAGWTISGIDTTPKEDKYTSGTGVHGTLPSALIGTTSYYYSTKSISQYSNFEYTLATNGKVSGVFATTFKNLTSSDSNGKTVTFTANWKKIEDKAETDSKQVITYAKSSYDKDTLFNIASQSAEYKYNNGKTSITGTATTPVDQIATSTNNVTYKVETIKRTTAYKYNPVTKQSYDYSYTYEATSPTWSQDSITYKTENMLIEAEKYQPMNLVRGNNAWATSADCGEYATNNDGKLDINATDAGTKRTSPYFSTGSLVAIDNNSDTPLYLKFNNDTLGLPDEYNWHNESLAESIGNLENGSWEYSNPSLGYCNDRFTNEDSDGYFRYNLKFNAGLTTLSSTYPTASLISPSGDEVDASTALDSSYVGGNGWFIRFIQAGKYTTKSNTTGDFSDWWCDTYTIGKGYEYGTKYDYTLTTTGLEEPTNITHGHYSNGAIVVDAGTRERGLYVTCYSQDVVQPVLYCEWDVSTVASMYYG